MTDKTITDNIKKLKPGPAFIVDGKQARINVIRVAWDLKRFKEIDFKIVTRSIGKGKYKVIAI